MKHFAQRRKARFNRATQVADSNVAPGGTPPTAPKGARRLRRGKAGWTNRDAVCPEGVRCRGAAPNQTWGVSPRVIPPRNPALRGVDTRQGLHLSERFYGMAMILDIPLFAISQIATELAEY